MRVLILSPYAENGLCNSGDHLIIKSLIDILNNLSQNQINIDVISIAKSTIDKEKIFNNLDMNKYKAIICPGFRWTIGEKEQILTTRLKYIEKAIRLKIPLYLIGSSWCIYPGIEEQTKFKINARESILFGLINENKINYISTRDKFTSDLLYNNFNYDMPMTGDVGLFDLEKIHTPIDIKESLTFAVSLPHNRKHYRETFLLAAKLKTYFKSDVFITSHQKETEKFKFGNIKYINLSGNSNKFKFYDNITFHVGFRLHAHVYFLKKRKPTFLIAEDGRGYGNILSFSKLGIHAAPNYILDYAKKYKYESVLLKNIGKNAMIDIIKVVKMIEDEMFFNYPETKKTFNIIDYIWTTELLDVFNKLLKG